LLGSHKTSDYYLTLSPAWKGSCSGFVVSLEFFPKKVLGSIILNPHTFAGEVKRHPEVETLLVTRDNRPEVMEKVLNWPTEG
jgi:hypothetical protein